MSYISPKPWVLQHFTGLLFGINSNIQYPSGDVRRGARHNGHGRFLQDQQAPGVAEQLLSATSVDVRETGQNMFYRLV